jgi:hypothetical protein
MKSVEAAVGIVSFQINLTKARQWALSGKRINVVDVSALKQPTSLTCKVPRIENEGGVKCLLDR